MAAVKKVCRTRMRVMPECGFVIRVSDKRNPRCKNRWHLTTVSEIKKEI